MKSICSIDAMVALKIIQHCEANKPNIVTGHLLGLDISSTIEVTNCFPMPEKGSEEASDETYQLEMMKALRNVNGDDNTIGWYLSSLHASFLHEAQIQQQYHFQMQISNSIILVYELDKSGFSALSAYHLTPQFMQLYNANDFSNDKFAKSNINLGSLFEQIPIQIITSSHVNALFYTMSKSGLMDWDITESAAENLSLTNNEVITSNLKQLSDAVDDYSFECMKYLSYIRYLKNNKKDSSSVSRMPAYLIAQQLSHFANQIKDVSKPSLIKQFILDSLYEEKREEKD